MQCPHCWKIFGRGGSTSLRPLSMRIRKMHGEERKDTEDMQYVYYEETNLPEIYDRYDEIQEISEVSKRVHKDYYVYQVEILKINVYLLQEYAHEEGEEIRRNFR